MDKKMKFFVYLIESYAAYKNKTANEVLEELDNKNLTNLVYEMYFQYHQEALKNALQDIDTLIARESK